MTVPVAARSEMLGGVLLIFAGALLFISFILQRSHAKSLTNKVTLWIALSFCVLGCGWLVNGLKTEASNRKRVNKVKTNLDTLSDAIDALEQSRGNPAEDVQSVLP